MEQLLKGGVSSVMLQNIEQRLEALEQTAGAGKAEAGYTRSIDKRKVSVIYIDADKLIK